MNAFCNLFAGLAVTLSIGVIAADRRPGYRDCILRTSPFFRWPPPRASVVRSEEEV